MPLRLERFVERRINWEPKSRNLVEMAGDLELGLDSFIFVDDNAEECAEVEANCPGVLVLRLPENPAGIPRFLKHVWAFDHTTVTEEDRKRTALYGQKLERARLEREAASLEDFIASLRLEIRIEPMAPPQTPRVAQLTQRTNQMNVAPLRRTESDIQRLVQERAAEVLAVTVSDRFGSYGLTGVVIFRGDSDALLVDTFLLSCRVLGRGVEHRMLARLGEIAGERGYSRVDVPFIPAQRNRPAMLFLDSVGGPFKQPCDGGFVFQLPAEHARSVSYKPGSGSKAPAEGTRTSAPAKTGQDVDFARIATELASVDGILKQLAGPALDRPKGPAPSAAPRTGSERRLVEVWSELLGVARIGVDDNFFDLGGHSLLAVQLISRIRRDFGVELSLEIVYGGAFTVAEMAKAIELAEIERAGEEQYAMILRELEGLTDEEVRELLTESERNYVPPMNADERR
jgi:FkbH-like protein